MQKITNSWVLEFLDQTLLENHENWYPTKIKPSTVCCLHARLAVQLTGPPYQTGQFTATLPLSCGKVAANNLVHQKREMQFAAIRNYWLTCGELIAKGSPQYYWFAKSSLECNYSPKVHYKSDCSPKIHHK